MPEQEKKAEKARTSVHHHYYFGEPSARQLGLLRGRLGRPGQAGTGSVGSGPTLCVCEPCYCDCGCVCVCDCAGRLQATAIATLIEGLQAQLGEIRQITAALKERK